VDTGLLRGFLALVASLAAFSCIPSTATAASRPRVLVVHFSADINPVTQDFVNHQIDRAGKGGYSAVVILLDTPGGLSTSMEKIYEKELASKVPVIVYVSPKGAGAASAGVFVAEAADLLAMAPETNIGSSTPIDQSGGNLNSDLRRKVINHFAAKLRALAGAHGRNAKWADAAVRKASNLTATEALRMNVVDAVAPDLPTLLRQIDGRKTKPNGYVLHTANAELVNADGKTDVLGVVNGYWRVAYSGTSGWQPLRSKLSDSVSSLLVADFNGDGRADVAMPALISTLGSYTGWTYQVSYNGTGDWVPLRTYSLNQTGVAAIGRFDQSAGADILLWADNHLEISSQGTRTLTRHSREDMR